MSQSLIIILVIVPFTFHKIKLNEWMMQVSKRVLLDEITHEEIIKTAQRFF